ncbi:hypothetical protein K439DRAFT_1638525 [Ramaria rubella]|nr:hypothetical protein K439DRAFT_1638525 [Ramaria rubella]
MTSYPNPVPGPIMFPLLVFVPALLSTSVYAITTTVCAVSTELLDIPTGQSNISVSASLQTAYIAIGLGTQNYSCSSSGTYVSTGAVAELFDISCLSADSSFGFLRKRYEIFPDSDAVWEHEAQVRATLGAQAERLGMYYHVSDLEGYTVPQTAVAGSLIPVWDFRGFSIQGDNQAFVAGEVVGTLVASDPLQDIPWQQYEVIAGDLSIFVFSVDTHFGQPPSSCSPGSADIQVRYSAKYWFLKAATSTSSPASTFNLETDVTGSNSFKSSSVNAAVSSDSDLDPAMLQQILKYAPVILALLGVTTILSLILVVLATMNFWRGRRSGITSRSASAAYQPVQLPRAKHMEESYHDEIERYGS